MAFKTTLHQIIKVKYQFIIGKLPSWSKADTVKLCYLELDGTV